MQKNSKIIYKTPPQLEELLRHQQQHQNQQRRRTAVLPKRSWVQRHPRLFQITCITTSLLVFFSKPIYDVFIADPLPSKSGAIVPGHKR